MLSQTAEYALRAVLHLAAAPASGPVHVATIAEALEVPQNYLSKVLHALARQGVLSSVRGPHGGFALARDPARLTLAEVIERFDPVHDRCLLMRRQCSDSDPCIAHFEWKQVANRIRSFFRETTVADLLANAAGSRGADPLIPHSPLAG